MRETASSTGVETLDLESHTRQIDQPALTQCPGNTQPNCGVIDPPTQSMEGPASNVARVNWHRHPC